MCIRDRCFIASPLYSTCLLRALHCGIVDSECGYGPTTCHGLDSYIFSIILNFMCTLWIVYSEPVLWFCVVFSSGHFAWLFLCLYDTHLVASLEHSGAAQRKKST